MNLENIVNDIGLVDFMFICFCIGYVTCMIHDILFSFIDYINNKVWYVRDYEKIIYTYVGPYDGIGIEEEEIIVNAHINYEKRLNKRKNIENLKNKIANLFKKKK